jgi:predicted transcriptional regulator
MTVKEQLVKIVNDLPDNCTYEDAEYQLYVQKKLKRGLAAADHGEVVSHEEVRKRVKEWLTK